MALRASEDARQIDDILRNQGSKDTKRFAHLKPKAEKRKVDPAPKEKMGGGWNEKITKMRETYPNAYMPWESGDDATLIDAEFHWMGGFATAFVMVSFLCWMLGYMIQRYLE